MSTIGLKPGHEIRGAVLVKNNGHRGSHIWRCPCGATFRATSSECAHNPRCPSCPPAPGDMLPQRGILGTIALAIIRGAAELGAVMDEFSEWDLTVAAWTINRKALGMRGYSDSYPDHKKVMACICKELVPRGLLERTIPNYYRITSKGLKALKDIRGGDDDAC